MKKGLIALTIIIVVILFILSFVKINIEVLGQNIQVTVFDYIFNRDMVNQEIIKSLNNVF